MSRHFRALPALAIAFFASSASSWAATYYVDANNGANANNGSAASPWRECPGTVSPTGSTSGWVVIPGGSRIVFTAGQTWRRPLKISSTWFANPGGESDRITLESSSNSTKAVIDLSGYGSTFGVSITRDYVTVKGLEVENVAATGYVYGVYVQASYAKVLNCKVHHIYNTASNLAYGIANQVGSYLEVADNEVFNTDTKGISGHSTANYGTFHHNWCTGRAIGTETSPITRLSWRATTTRFSATSSGPTCRSLALPSSSMARAVARIATTTRPTTT